MRRMPVNTLLRSLPVGLLVVAGALCGTLVAAQNAEEPPAEASVWEEVQRLYEKAKAAGESVPKDVVEWVKQDFSHIGAWQYRVAEVPSTDARAIEDRLNEMGGDRWECIRVETHGVKTRLYFKRPAKSYLRQIPLSDLLKILPRGDADDGGE